MNKNDYLRLTLDLPPTTHKKLKTFAAINQKSMRSVLIELIEKHLQMKDPKIKEG